MDTWWFKKKMRDGKAFVSVIKLLPDLKARTLVVIFSFLMIVSFFLIGVIVGQDIEANRSIKISGGLPYEKYDDQILRAAQFGKNSLYATSSVDKNFVASESGSVYYPKTCKSYSRIKEENRVWFKTELLARSSGYSLAKNCSTSN